MKSRVVAAFVSGVVVALLWWRQTHAPLSYYSSRSYVDRVNALIEKSALEYDPRTDHIVISDRATDAEKKWYNASYLADDVRLYNRNRELFGHLFVVRDGALQEINPFLRVRQPAVAQSAHRHGGANEGDEVAVFATLRQWKNEFR